VSLSSVKGEDASSDESDNKIFYALSNTDGECFLRAIEASDTGTGWISGASAAWPTRWDFGRKYSARLVSTGTW
jgi:hypothetical protein